jgi:hypothetical protein
MPVLQRELVGVTESVAFRTSAARAVLRPRARRKLTTAFTLSKAKQTLHTTCTH